MLFVDVTLNSPSSREPNFARRTSKEFSVFFLLIRQKHGQGAGGVGWAQNRGVGPHLMQQYNLLLM